MEFQLQNKTFISSMVGIAAAVAVAGSANAGIPASTTAFSPAPSNLAYDAGTGNDLLVFTVGASDIAVTSLGLFNGYTGARAVGIFAWNGTNAGTGPALGQASVTTNNSTAGYTYSSPTNFTLLANQQYVLVGQSVSGMTSDTALYVNAGAGSGITFNSYWFNGGAPLDPVGLAASANYSPAYFNANFQFSAVPAPGALALLGVAGLVGARRRRA
jgi:MYXO-CTERM domain-containing protein